MTQKQLSPDEVAAWGELLYEQHIRSRVEAPHRRQFVVIDVNSGNYEIAADDLTATRRLLAAYPNARIYGLRIGHPTAYRLGGSFVAANE